MSEGEQLIFQFDVVAQTWGFVSSTTSSITEHKVKTALDNYLHALLILQTYVRKLENNAINNRKETTDSSHRDGNSYCRDVF